MQCVQQHSNQDRVCFSALVAGLSDSIGRGAPAGGSTASAGGLERLQRATAVPAAEESCAAHPEALEESPADATHSRAPPSGRLEELQTETDRLQGAAGPAQVRTLTSLH